MCIYENNREAIKITDKTLFLLGNGCSMEYGFPAGGKLLLECFNLIQEYRYSEKYRYFSYNLYQKLEYFLSIFSDIREKVLSGSLDGVHIPYYSTILHSAYDPDLCMNRKQCLNCSDSRVGEIGFDISTSKHICCREIKEILAGLPAWDIFSELCDKYYDKKTYGQGNLEWKKNNITAVYDALAKLLTDTLFFYQEEKHQTCDAFYQFIRGLKGFSGTIIDLNYDLLLDQSVTEKTFNIVKPHGSFDLFYYEGEPNQYWDVAIVQKNIYRLKTKKAIREFGYGRYSAFAKPLNIAYANINTHLFTSETYQARFVNEYTMPVIENLKQDIKRCDKVVSIGYSFPKTDSHIANLFDSKKIYVIGKNIDDTERIANSVKDYYQHKEILPTSFEGFGNYARQIEYQK